jgi:hypothetical protein
MGYVWERIRLAAKNGFFQAPQMDSLNMVSLKFRQVFVNDDVSLTLQ